jgi:pantoate--beta-alanine ligase
MVCAKLFNIVLPDAAYFGQKDGQQSVVIRRMAADLKMPLRIVVCPTVREADGLAVSSRNKYLGEQQRKDAGCIYGSLAKCREMIEAGVRDSEQIISEMRRILEQVASMEIEYVSLVDAETLEPVERLQGRIMAAVAVRLGSARLIDNIVVELP